MRYHNFLYLLFALILGSATMTAQDLSLVGDIYLNMQTLKPFTGVYQVRYDNGNLAAVYNLRDGKLHQSVVHYFEEGGIRQTGQYFLNERHGLWLEWNENGQLISQAQFNNGVKHGVWKVWDNQGICRRNIRYSEGSSAGTWQSFNEYAELIEQKIFE